MKPEAPQNEALEIDIYQIVKDDLLAKNRTDGTGWDIAWADYRRDWMDATSSRFAYRCLPLTIVNQLGFCIPNPVGFTARWKSRSSSTIDFKFDAAGDTWSQYVVSHFGNGVITWHTPYLFRTRPTGSRLLVMGPPNGGLKPHCHALTGLIETDWISMSFTMNWKIITPGEDIRFERGEPLFHAIPMARNPCLDIEHATVTYRRITDAPELAEVYNKWVISRRDFRTRKTKGELGASDWQKHYFRGVNIEGEPADTEHFTRIATPQIRMLAGTKVEPAKMPSTRSQTLKATVTEAPASRLAPADPTLAGDARVADARSDSPVGRANALGWWVFSPCDLALVWRGGRAFELKLFTAEEGGGAESLQGIVEIGEDAEGVVTIWTGLSLQTPPGWCLKTQSPANVLSSPFVRVQEEILDTDAEAKPLAIKLRFVETGRPLHLRSAAAWPPLAQLVPIPREVSWDVETSG